MSRKVIVGNLQVTLLLTIFFGEWVSKKYRKREGGKGRIKRREMDRVG